MIRWAAVILASLSWLFAFGHFVPEYTFSRWMNESFGGWLKGDSLAAEGVAALIAYPQARQYGLVALAVLLGAIGLRPPAARPRFAELLAVVPLAVAMVFVPQPLAIAVLVLTVGLLLRAVGSVVPGLGWLCSAGASAALIGTVLVVQYPLDDIVCAWTARNPEMPFLAYPVYALFRWVGSDVSLGDGVLYVRLMRETHKFPLLWEHVAAFAIAAIWAAGAVVLWIDRSRRAFGPALLRLSLVLLGFGVFRVFVMIAVFISAMIFVEHESTTVHVEVFWLPAITALSFLPLVVLLARFVPWPADAAGFAAGAPAHGDGRRPWLATALAGLGVFALAFSSHYWDPGRPKGGRILLDEAHSRWERTDHPYDTDWYGHESGYNYYCMAQYLRHFYTLDFNMDGKLTPERLSQYDVLILKTPTERYDSEEIDAIEKFVRDGGGVFALGEHTNVFGSSVCLNPVTRRFGIAFRYDSVFDLNHKWEQTHIPAALGRHPIMNGLEFFRFAVSCSIDTDSWDIRPVVRSRGLWTLPITYAAGNFYPHVEDTAYARFGAFNQMVTTTAGRGRVAAFGDSTVYSNFLAFYPGKPELLLRTVDWLNRTNRWSSLNGAAWWLGAGLLAAAAVVAFRCPSSLGLAAQLAAFCLGAAWLGVWLLDRHARENYPPPAAKTPVQQIVFDAELGDYELPLFGFIKHFQKAYETFYQYVLRVGCYTTVTFDLDEALGRLDPVVIVRPNKSPSPDTLAALRQYVERGGSLLVLDSPTNGSSTANELLSPFGLSVGKPATGRAIIEPESGARICQLPTGSVVAGGQPLLRTNAGEAVVARVSLGRGQVIAAGLAERFTDVSMGGGSRVLPDRELRSVYELEFELVRGLIAGDVGPAMKRLGETLREPPPATAPATP